MTNAKDCRKALATTCRDALEPPVTATSQVETVDGHDIVVAEIQEAHATAKPVRVKKEGKAYLRQHDGDFALSENEEQAFLVSRTVPRFDAAVAPEATIDDLDPDSSILGRRVPRVIEHTAGVRPGRNALPHRGVGRRRSSALRRRTSCPGLLPPAVLPEPRRPCPRTPGTERPAGNPSDRRAPIRRPDPNHAQRRPLDRQWDDSRPLQLQDLLTKPRFARCSRSAPLTSTDS